MEKILGLIYTVIIIFTIVFQVGLILGKPWGEYTLGGVYKGSLPTKYRVAPAVSIIVLSVLVLYVLQHVKLLNIIISFPTLFSWFVIGFHILSFVLNSITQSKKERRLWQPLTGILLVTIILIHLV